MKESGSMTKHKALVFILIWMELNMLVRGMKINSMEKERKVGQMALCMRVIMFLERSKVLVIFSGLMDRCTLGSSSITT